jgi:hypothetical protein
MERRRYAQRGWLGRGEQAISIEYLRLARAVANGCSERADPAVAGCGRQRRRRDNGVSSLVRVPVHGCVTPLETEAKRVTGHVHLPHYPLIPAPASFPLGFRSQSDTCMRDCRQPVRHPAEVPKLIKGVHRKAERRFPPRRERMGLPVPNL